MWAVAALGLIGAITTFVVRSYNRDIDYYVPAAEVERIENERFAQLKKSGPLNQVKEAAWTV
jgi:cytochrome o ubiquinol oxidase subunit 1